ncbi:MAG: glutamine synthetase [Eubacterium sp.]|nr:glutamine synthetase [Eubacterium sp.]
MRTKDDVINYVKNENVKFIRLAFCDIFGKEKNIAIMPEELPTAFDKGIRFDASTVPNFGEGIYTDLYLHPEPDTLSILPWKEENDGAVRMFCTMTYPDGTPFTERGTKSLLLKAIDRAEVMGYEFYFGFELEFYLFKLDKNGNPTNIPYDNGTYLDISPDDNCETIRRDICVALVQMGLHVQTTLHEVGPGQNEICFGYSDPITAGNNITTLKTVIKNVAKEHGAYADFSPKPIEDENGCGLHINISVRADDGTDTALNYVAAGILDKINDITAFCNPTRDSYRRLGKYGAPKYISWSSQNRDQLLTIPHNVGKYRNCELRSTDPTINPFLVFSLLINAGLHGIENNLELPEATDFDLNNAYLSVIESYKMLPEDLEDARYIAMKSEFIKKYVPQDIIDVYCKL